MFIWLYEYYCSPNIETTTGCDFRSSESGNVIDTVNTDPKLVPTHNVGSNDVGSLIKKEVI